MENLYVCEIFLEQIQHILGTNTAYSLYSGNLGENTNLRAEFHVPVRSVFLNG